MHAPRYIKQPDGKTGQFDIIDQTTGNRILCYVPPNAVDAVVAEWNASAYPQPQHPAPYVTGPQFGSAHPGSPFIPQPMVIPPKRVNHALHAVLTLFTFGLWLPVWILVGMFSQKKSKIVYPNGRVEYR